MPAMRLRPQPGQFLPAMVRPIPGAPTIGLKVTFSNFLLLWTWLITPDSGFNVTYDQNGSATGPKTYYIAYSTDGLTFTPFGSDYTLTSGITWASGTPNQATQLSDNFSAITALDTASTIYFRIVDDSLTTGGAINGGNIGTSGTDRIDNFLVSASVAPVPEPTTMALAGLSALSLIVFRRQRK